MSVISLPGWDVQSKGVYCDYSLGVYNDWSSGDIECFLNHWTIDDLYDGIDFDEAVRQINDGGGSDLASRIWDAAQDRIDAAMEAGNERVRILAAKEAESERARILAKKEVGRERARILKAEFEEAEKRAENEATEAAAKSKARWAAHSAACDAMQAAIETGDKAALETAQNMAVAAKLAMHRKEYDDANAAAIDGERTGLGVDYVASARDAADKAMAEITKIEAMIADEARIEQEIVQWRNSEKDPGDVLVIYRTGSDLLEVRHQDKHGGGCWREFGRWASVDDQPQQSSFSFTLSRREFLDWYQVTPWVPRPPATDRFDDRDGKFAAAIASIDAEEKKKPKPITNYVNVLSLDGENAYLPLPMSTIIDKIQSDTGNWPRIVGGELFIHAKTKTDGAGRIDWLKNPAALFGWLQRQHGIIYWKRADDCVTKEELFAEYSRTAMRYCFEPAGNGNPCSFG